MAPLVSDAADWELADYMNNEILQFAEILSPTELTVDDSVTMREKRFSYVPAQMVQRNWFKVTVPGRRNKYFYGETARSEAQRYARVEDYHLEAAMRGW